VSSFKELAELKIQRDLSYDFKHANANLEFEQERSEKHNRKVKYFWGLFSHRCPNNHNNLVHEAKNKIVELEKRKAELIKQFYFSPLPSKKT
jgi:hypothetical protein